MYLLYKITVLFSVAVLDEHCTEKFIMDSLYILSAVADQLDLPKNIYVN